MKSSTQTWSRCRNWMRRGRPLGRTRPHP